MKATCKQVSKNAQCAACNPDNTCRLCDTSKLVVPMSATYINIPGSQSQVRSPSPATGSTNLSLSCCRGVCSSRRLVWLRHVAVTTRPRGVCPAL